MYNPDYIEWNQQRGWVCPKCGRVYSPTTPMCYYCGGGNEKIVNRTTTNLDDSGWWNDYLRKTTADIAKSLGDPFDKIML